MTIKTTTCYETADGEIFKTEAEAKSHQSELDFAEWYEKNTLYGSYAGSYIELVDLLAWLKDNKERLLKYFNG
jgi:hypothetical protein